jgi:hypothetical protein
MGSGKGEFSTRTQMFVVVDYPAIHRYDFGMWCYNIVSKSITEHCESAMCAVAYKSSVDVEKLEFFDLVNMCIPFLKSALISKGFTDEDILEQSKIMMNSIQEIYDKKKNVTNKTLRADKANKFGISDDEIKNMILSPKYQLNDFIYKQ